jgi:hypothetical protein
MRSEESLYTTVHLYVQSVKVQFLQYVKYEDAIDIFSIST